MNHSLAQRIEDYALIGNCETVALVGRNGSIDWLGFPRYDSPACFAALLGNEENGRWLISPKQKDAQVKRRYRDKTLVLETEWTTSEGTVVVTDCMNRHAENADVLRLVRGVSGQVAMCMELIFRFDYGSVAPWVTRFHDGRLRAVAGQDQAILNCAVPVTGKGLTSVAEFTIKAGEQQAFSLRWAKSYVATPASPDVPESIEQVSQGWSKWAQQFNMPGPWSEAVLRSAITLKALAHHQTGGIVAAATTSLPEAIGGPRNWDYRFCWLRDSTFTLYALMNSGFLEEAKAWRAWLIRAVAGSPEKMQIMYGVAGERRLQEYELPWLSGYENSTPVRIGNAASEQLQLDVYGEVLDMLYQAKRTGLADFKAAWSLERALVEHLETIWKQPDEGIWEVRGGARNFTYSKVMAWVAVDRAVRTIEQSQAEGPLERWKQVRSEIHQEICDQAFNKQMNSFVQSYGATQLDASLLLIPSVGFLPATDPRMMGTVAAIEKALLKDGFVQRYDYTKTADGLSGSEGVFLACSFWLADNYVLQGQREKAVELFEKLLALRNDVGLLSEEYDVAAQRQVGNFPQAFSHVSLVNTAANLQSHGNNPAQHRANHAPTKT